MDVATFLYQVYFLFLRQLLCKVKINGCSLVNGHTLPRQSTGERVSENNRVPLGQSCRPALPGSLAITSILHVWLPSLSGT